MARDLVLTVAVPALVTLALVPFHKPEELLPSSWYLLGVAILALIAGLRAALVAAALSSVALWFAVLPPRYTLRPSHPIQLLALAMFAAASAALSVLVSRLERTRKEVAASEERFRTSVDNLTNPLSIFSSLRDSSGELVDFIWTYANEPACTSVRYRREQLLGKRLLDVLPGHATSGLFQQYRTVVETGRAYRNPSLWYEDLWGDGRRYRRAFSVSTAKLGDGFVITWEDVTEERRVEEAVRESEERFRLTFEEAPIGMSLVGLDGHILKANDRLGQILGYSAEKLVNRDFRSITHPDDLPREEENLERLLNGDLPAYSLEKRYLHSDGHLVWALLHVSLVRSDGIPSYFVAQVEDITERKRTEEQLRYANAELARSNRELEQFAYVASHDLQEPLRTIAGFVQLLSDSLDRQLDTRTREYMDFIVDASARMRKLIQGLLAYSRVGRRGEEFQLCSLEEQLDKALQSLHAALEETKAVITHDPLPTVCADPNQLEQLLVNLIGNSLKFRKAEVTPRVHLSALRRDSMWEISVRDNGIGFDPKYVDRIFVIFQRLQPSSRYEGTGIGLAICRRIVERHGGTIWVQSVSPDGAEFRFTLPAGAPDAVG